jgi:hypothetical protein
MPVSGGALAEALAGAAAVAAYTSNALTDAALAGTALLAGAPGAMAWPVAGQGLAAVPSLGDRTSWSARLAWCQWRHAEMQAGEAWEALAGAMEPGSGWTPADDFCF